MGNKGIALSNQRAVKRVCVCVCALSNAKVSGASIALSNAKVSGAKDDYKHIQPLEWHADGCI